MATTSPPLHRLTPGLHIAFRGPAGRLLLALIVLSVAEPLIVRGAGWSLLTGVAWNAALVAGLFAAAPHRSSRTFGLSLAGLDFLVHPLAAFGVAPSMIHVHSFLAFCMMTYTAVWLLGDVLESTRVTARTLKSAVCVYILMGLVWMHLYLLTDFVWPGSFRFPDGLSTPDAGYAGRRHQTAELLYFSFVTLSTVGYGDVTPVRGVARGFAALEGMAGQIYLAILIARLVGLQVSQSIEESA